MLIHAKEELQGGCLERKASFESSEESAFPRYRLHLRVDDIPAHEQKVEVSKMVL